MLEELKQKLIKLEAEYSDFRNQHKLIFAKKNELENTIDQLTLSIFNETNKVKPDFPLPSLRLNNFAAYFDDVNIIISEDDIKKFEGDDISVLLGWKVDYESDGHTTHTDGDWYDYSLELTSPEGYVYSYSDETCLMNGEFENAKLS